MNNTEWLNLLKLRNAKIKSDPVSFQTLYQGYVNQLQGRLTMAGGNPALFDYPAGTTVANAATGNAATSVFDLGKHHVANVVAVRVVTTIGATPTASFDIQGSNDQATWSSLNFEDSGSPGTFAPTPFVITTATTVVKYVALAQKVRYIRVNVTSNTNVTYTIDITQL